ncbi:hypothetical protein SATMO3_21510 [Sporomusa aerivorans]
MELDRVIEKEYEAATQKFTPFASAHEGYAVIKEQLEDATDKIEFLTNQLDVLMHIKEDRKAQQQDVY